MNLTETEVLVSLELAPDEPIFVTPESQGSLQRINEGLQAAGITARHRMNFRDAAGGPGLMALFVVPVAQIVIPALGVVLVGWLQGRAGRKVRLKVGDIEAEARTPEEVEKLLLCAKQFQQGAVPERSDTQELKGDP
jgi:hypothetical protein